MWKKWGFALVSKLHSKEQETKNSLPKNKELDAVIPLGLEPKTHSLEGCCSIQLSYGTKSECKINHFFDTDKIYS